MIKQALAASIFVSLVACINCAEQPKTTSSPIPAPVGMVECSGQSCPMPEIKAETKEKVFEIEQAQTVKNACPDRMVEIDGNFCSNPDFMCLYWVDNHGNRSKERTDRCGEYRQETHCNGKTKHLHFCEDKFEFPNWPGVLPRDWMTFYDAKWNCENIGKRLCTKSEWMLGAEGPDLHPLPYGDGFHRDHSCNIDQHIKDVGLTGSEVMSVRDPNSETAQKLRSQLVPSGSMPDCASGYDVMDASGNIDEWVVNEAGAPYVSSLVGGHQYGVRNASFFSTDGHGPNFKWYETGMRCCLTP